MSEPAALRALANSDICRSDKKETLVAARGYSTLLIDAEGHAFGDASQIGIFDTRGTLIQLDVCVPTCIVGRLCLGGWTVVVVGKNLLIGDHKFFGRGVGDENRALKDDVLVSMGGIPGLVSSYGCLELVDTAVWGDFREADDSECAVA